MMPFFMGVLSLQGTRSSFVQFLEPTGGSAVCANQLLEVSAGILFKDTINMPAGKTVFKKSEFRQFLSLKRVYMPSFKAFFFFFW